MQLLFRFNRIINREVFEKSKKILGLEILERELKFFKRIQIRKSNIVFGKDKKIFKKNT
jgi:hypothetical protein